MKNNSDKKTVKLVRWAPRILESPPRGGPISRSSVMKPPGISDDAVVVMGCGDITMRKGVDLFISAASALKHLSPSRRFRFVWVGKDTEYLYTRYLAEQIERCGLTEAVEFIGEPASFDRVCGLADIFFLSSRLDPFPKAAIKAMLNGLPVVCFENGSATAEMLSNHGDLQKLVAPYLDAYSAAAIIDLLCTDTYYRAVSKRAVRTMALSVDIDRYCEQVDSFTKTVSLLPGRQEQDLAPRVGDKGFVEGLCRRAGGEDKSGNGPAGWQTLYRHYDRSYRIWKKHRQTGADREQTLRLIGELCGIGSFFLLYPLYKLIKPCIKLQKTLSRRSVKSPGRGARIYDPSKKTVLLVSHEASKTGAPLIAFNLLEKFASKYNVISVLLGPGSLERAFKSCSVATLGPFSNSERYSAAVHAPIFRLCQQFSPSFAVVNSLESREALVALRKAGVPSVLLVHEFASLWQVDMKRVAAGACQMVFPAPLVWRDAVGMFPQIASRPVNIIHQGQCRIPLEWLHGETSRGEAEHIASLMRPLGAKDDAVVVMGCGTIEMRKGVDLFLAAADALKRLSPALRFRFVWVGKEIDPVFTRYLSEQIERCGLTETVKFLGELSSVDMAYRLADIFFLSSRLDPFPNVAIEAMLNGLPVVCFENASGTAEMLSRRDDLNKLVAPHMDAYSAARKIDLLCTDHCFRAAVKTAVRNLAVSFDRDRYCDQIDSLAQRATQIMSQQQEDAATITRDETCMSGMDRRLKGRKEKDALIRSWVYECAGCEATSCPFPGFDPEIYRKEHPELNEPPFVNPLAHFLRSGQPQGPWLLTRELHRQPRFSHS
ncbi:MAG: glycosyltransferase [Syntrophobacteraceae bacterium]|nr:glycosyltransferase [Syntrophobacteraceae bacterium]